MSVHPSLLLICDYDLQTTVASSSHECQPLGLAAAVSECVDQQFGTNCHRICEAQTLWNSLRVGSRTNNSSGHMAGGASDRSWLKVHHISGLTSWCLLIYLWSCLNG